MVDRNPNRQFDKTYLSLDNAEERQLVHRDYIAHCLRWSHVVKHMIQHHRFKDCIVVDVGCGKEMPLAKMLYVNKLSPRLYVGVDMSTLIVPPMLDGKKIPIRLWGQTDFTTLSLAQVGEQDFVEAGGGFVRPKVITSFEVLEHVMPGHARKMLIHMKHLIDPMEGVVMISTPCWNGDAAMNHINEMTYDALGAMIEDVGFAIDGHYGTFASQSEYKYLLGEHLTYEENGGQRLTARGVFESLKQYYDSNLMSILFAPLYPQASRNCFWKLSVASPDYVRKFPPLASIEGPWSQHQKWEEMNGPKE